jgi:hypothetical protein
MGGTASYECEDGDEDEDEHEDGARDVTNAEPRTGRGDRKGRVRVRPGCLLRA